jgi:hypothetical protein
VDKISGNEAQLPAGVRPAGIRIGHARREELPRHRGISPADAGKQNAIDRDIRGGTQVDVGKVSLVRIQSHQRIEIADAKIGRAEIAGRRLSLCRVAETQDGQNQWNDSYGEDGGTCRKFHEFNGSARKRRKVAANLFFATTNRKKLRFLFISATDGNLEAGHWAAHQRM